MATAAVRQRNAERLPWVTPVGPGQSCDGIKWGTVALRDLYDWGPMRDGEFVNPARGIQPKSRCSKRGKWRFRATQNSLAKDGIYCWHHLISQGLYCDSVEQDRTNRWYAKHGYVGAE